MKIIYKFDLKSISKIRDEIVRDIDLVKYRYYDCGTIYILNEVCLEFYCNSLQDFAYQLYDYTHFNLSKTRSISDNDNYNLVVQNEANIIYYCEEWNEFNYSKMGYIDFSNLYIQGRMLYESINLELIYLINDILKTSQFEDHQKFLKKGISPTNPII